jgi:hypothetical protein
MPPGIVAKNLTLYFIQNIRLFWVLEINLHNFRKFEDRFRAHAKTLADPVSREARSVIHY